MFCMYLNEEQLKLLLSVVDRDLRHGGLDALASAVELHNLIAGAERVADVEKTPEEASETPEEGVPTEVRPTE